MAGPLEVGRVVKPHGLRGDVVVTLITSEAERRLFAGAALERERGDPLVVLDARPHQKRWIVRFEGVNDKAAADALRGVALLAPPLEDPDALWVHEIVGAEVVDTSGNARGTVAAVVANPAADLLELDSGALVPETFVIGWDAERRLVVDPPDGLFDL